MKSTWLCLATLLTGACTTEIVQPEGPGIDEYIQSLPYLPVAPAQVDQGTRSADKREGDYSCSTQNLKETRQFDKIVAYAANSDSMFPGAIISADSVLSGLFTQLVLDRAPATISVSLENLGGKKSAVIETPTLSAYREALTGVLQQEITGSTPANQSSEIEEVHSKEQLDMALGVQASWGLGVASLKTSFDWSKQETRSRYVVKFTQSYYTVDLDAPQSPSSLFAPTVQLADVQAKMDETRPPVYVASVTYGRMVLFTFESEYSSQEMGAALEFAYRGGVDVKGDVSINYKEMLSKSKITAFILGGNAGTAVETIDSYDKLISFIKTGGNYSRESPGAPIAYKLNYLKDNSPARMSFTTDYDVKDCVRVSQKVRVTLNAIAVDDAGGDAGSDLELYGQIWVESSAGGSAMMFNKNSDNYVRVREGQQFGQGQPLAEAVIDVAPKAGQTIRLRANLRDVDDFLNPDDDLGNESVNNLFETGWRKESTVTLTGDSARIRVVFSLTPI
jgi:thiol-activated cytolysin